MNSEELTTTQVNRAEEIALTENTVAMLRELLTLTEEFLRTASPAVHAELRTYLNQQVPPADPNWFIDMLGLNASHLARQLPEAAPRPRETWTNHVWGQLS